MRSGQQDLDTGDDSQWDFIHRFAPERFSVVTSDGASIPRAGSHMARVEVRHKEPASWVAELDVALGGNELPALGLGQLGGDSYVGFSVFLRTDSSQPRADSPTTSSNGTGTRTTCRRPFTSWSTRSTVGTTASSNRSPGFVLDLHTEPGYNPAMFRFGDLVTGRWVDFVIHVKWATDSSG